MNQARKLFAIICLLPALLASGCTSSSSSADAHQRRSDPSATETARHEVAPSRTTDNMFELKPEFGSNTANQSREKELPESIDATHPGTDRVDTVKPIVPPTIGHNSQRAAHEFFDYYFAATIYAFESLDTSIIGVHGSMDCENCLQTYNTIGAAVGADFPVTNIAIVPTTVLDVWAEDAGYYHVEFDGNALVAKSLNGAGFEFETAVTDVAGSAQVAYVDGQWTMLSYGPVHAVDIPPEFLG